MNYFLKIGLPWASSIVLAFYLGGHFLGEAGDSTSTSQSKGLAENKGSLKGEQTSPGANPKISIPGGVSVANNSSPRESSDNTFSPTTLSPPLPPNLRRIMKGRDIISRLGSYLDAVRAMDGSNVNEVVTAFEELPKGYGRHLEMKLLMRSWAAIDPQAALAYANKSLDQKSERRFGVSEVLAGWANSDPQGAVEWAKANSNNAKNEDNAMLVGIIRGLAENNLGVADELFRGLPEGGARWQASTFLAQEYAKLGTKEAIEWAENFPNEDSKMRETILGQLGAKLARQDLPGTADWVSKMDHDKGSQRITDNLLMQWVSQDATEASRWVEGLEDTQKRTYAMKQLTARWSLSDPVSTAKWLNTLPQSPSMDSAVGEFVNRISARDPEGAMGWAMTIQNPNEKTKALNRALGAWEKIDPAKARSWKQANNLEN
jgi:hypothetical protein